MSAQLAPGTAYPLGATPLDGGVDFCQDNEISWFDWSLPEKHGDIFRFVKHLIAARLGYGLGRADADTLLALLEKVQIEFGGITPGRLDAGPTSHALAASRRSASGAEHFYLIVNAYWEPLTFTLPSPPATAPQGWRLWLDTNRLAPDDIHGRDDMPAVDENSYLAAPRSIVVLVAQQQSRDATTL